MGTAQSKHDECDDEELQDAKRLLEEKGVVGADDVIREKLEGWRNVNVKIGVTGSSGCGKSSFINAFRGYGHFNYQYLSSVFYVYLIREQYIVLVSYLHQGHDKS